MELLDGIGTKRSVRKYTDEQLPEAVVSQLISLGTMASTGSNHQPWGFLVLQGKAEIETLSDEIKAFLRQNLANFPYLQQYEGWLTNPKFSVFNHASTVICVYGDEASHWYVYDCTLAAGNIMLAAHDMGIGTCWIGFAEHFMNTPQFKKRHGVAEGYQLVAPLSCGYSAAPLSPPSRKPPVRFGV